jgi:hypothetical protein
VTHKLASQKPKLRPPLDVAHFSAVRLQFYSLQKMQTNRVNNTGASLAFARKVIGQYEFADFRILNEQNFNDVEFWLMREPAGTPTSIRCEGVSKWRVGHLYSAARLVARVRACVRSTDGC